MLSYPWYGLVIAFVAGFVLCGTIIYVWWKWSRKDPTTELSNLVEVEKLELISLTESKLKDKNKLIFTVIGLAVARSVAESIKLTYMFRHFDEHDGIIYIAFASENSVAAFEKANAHLGIINGLLNEIATALNFKHRLMGKILEITGQEK